MGAIGWVAVIIVFGLVIAAAVAVKNVKHKVQEFSHAAWGTDSITEGIEKMRRDYSATPKSLSAMTSLCLPKITKDFPEFKYDEMKSRAENVLISFLRGMDAENAEMLPYATRELKDRLKAEIEMRRAVEQREHFDSIDIHRTEISAYRKNQGRCIITFQSSVQYYNYITNRDGTMQDGNKELYTQSKYDVDMIYIQDRNIAEESLESGIGLNCPNCGAPLSGLGAKICEYCGSPVIELSIHVWMFNDVREITN